MTDKPLHVLELRAENFKKLTAVRLRLEDSGQLVVVGGKNAAGKSSCLDAVESALGGKSVVPQDPVRHGARKGKVVLDLGELRVERTFTDKSTTLKVTDADGVPVKSPQTALDQLVNKIAFDPLAFTRDDPKKQDETLKAVLGLDFSDLEAARAKLYEERKEAKKEAKKLDAQIDALPDEPGVPDAEVSVGELLEQIEERQAQKAENDEEREELVEASRELEQRRETKDEVDQEIAELEQQLKAKRKEREALADSIAVAERKLTEQQKVVEALVDPDVAELRAQIATVEQTNEKVRRNRERRQLEAELERQQAAAEQATDALASLDEEKAERLTSAQFPVDGLGFDETGPTLNGVPLEQASQAEKLRLSVAIGVALQPRVRVMLVREGSFLDRDGVRLLGELAREHDLQVWLERVSDDGEGCTIVIEDGAIAKEASAAE